MHPHGHLKEVPSLSIASILFTSDRNRRILVTYSVDNYKSFKLGFSLLYNNTLSDALRTILVWEDGSEICKSNFRKCIADWTNTCLLDYGSVYAFWLFSYKRYKGILGSQPNINSTAIDEQFSERQCYSHLEISSYSIGRVEHRFIWYRRWTLNFVP